MENQKKHYIYITFCKLTNEYYFGKHSTSNKNDGYTGSGVEINERIEKIGKENFNTLMFDRFKTEKEAYDYEENLIRFFIKDPKCLNKHLGGIGIYSDHARYKTKEGKEIVLKNDDPLVLNGEVVGCSKGVSVYILNGEKITLSTKDNNVLNGKIQHIYSNTADYIINRKRVKLKKKTSIN